MGQTTEYTSSLSPTALSFLAILSPPNPSPAAARLEQLKQIILLESLPANPTESQLIRPLVWKLLLRLHVVTTLEGDVHPLLKADRFYDLCLRPPSLMLTKIRNDTFRTLATDQQFKDKVGEERLVRLLEAFVWRQLGMSTS